MTQATNANACQPWALYLGDGSVIRFGDWHPVSLAREEGYCGA